MKRQSRGLERKGRSPIDTAYTHSILHFNFRLLCLDALVEEADVDDDWRLREDEFTSLMAQDYVPSIKCERNLLSSTRVPPQKQIWHLLHLHSIATNWHRVLIKQRFIADCVMDKKHFEDGTKTKVDCNGW